ncbi:MAG: tetratricopeptide repeat protein [Acidobacteria bacterium]|nr:MAG: tetratricopeptide repeat protein [Acidobacteriota bacterium]
MFFQRYGSISAGQAILAALLFVSGPAVPDAQPIRSEFEAVDRIVAIGDVHGAFDIFVANLKATGLVDDELDWIGGETHLVQTGDVVDRGPDSRKVLDLLMKLEPQAEAAGGKVHALIGNHEFYNVVGALGYVSEAEVKAFDGARDHALRRFRDVKNLPRGLLAHREAYSAEGVYGQWLRRNNAVVRIGDLLFVHGGVTPEIVGLGLAEINRRVRADLDTENWPESFSLSDEGPLMSRRFSDQIPDSWVEGVRDELRSVLAALGVRTMVMAHTVTYGLIEPRFDGAAILIDTGMFEDYAGGHQAALLIEKRGEKERFYAVYARGKVELPMKSGDAELDVYVEAAAEVSPNGDGLKRHLADVRKRQRRYQEAAELYEKIGVFNSKRKLPLVWRREAAECYEALGDENRATKLYTLYVEELERFAVSGVSSRLQLLNQYAWECLRLGLETEKALDIAREVSAAYPDNPSYRITLAWAHLKNGDAREARQILIALPEENRDRFYVQLVLGRAHAQLGDRARALEAFRKAQQHRPNDSEVAELIAELTSPF